MALVSFLSVVLLVGFVAVVCVQRQRSVHEKGVGGSDRGGSSSVGHYNGEKYLFGIQFNFVRVLNWMRP